MALPISPLGGEQERVAEAAAWGAVGAGQGLTGVGGLPGLPHFAPKAKRLIYLHMDQCRRGADLGRRMDREAGDFRIRLHQILSQGAARDAFHSPTAFLDVRSRRIHRVGVRLVQNGGLDATASAVDRQGRHAAHSAVGGRIRGMAVEYGPSPPTVAGAWSPAGEGLIRPAGMTKEHPMALVLKSGTSWAETYRRCMQVAPEAFDPDRIRNLIGGEWVRAGVTPPANKVPRVDNGTAVTRESLQTQYTQIPGSAWPTHLPQRLRMDFGPNPDRGVLTYPPTESGTYPILVSSMDADCNEVAGLRLPDVSVPLATYTGWNVRHEQMGNGGLMTSGAPLFGATLEIGRAHV